jgi:eukaryotic-like serine/threonine-protein kinase
VKSLAHDVELLESLEAPPGLEIWLARQIGLNRLVEVVALREGVTPKSPHAVAAIREAQAHSRLHHRAIFEVYSFSLDDSSMVMEREAPQGTPLALALPKLEQNEKIALLREIADALAHAHERRVLHGDLGLHRLVWVGQAVKIHGFCLQLESHVDTCPSDLVSGGGLRAPEVRLGAPFGVLAEVYSFGCLAWEILTGKSWPDAGKSWSGWPLGLDLPAQIEHVLSLCLSRNPAQRPPQMSYVAERLDPTFLAPRRPTTRSLPPVRRWGAAYLGLGGACLLAVGAGVGIYASTRIAREAPHLSVVPIESDSSRPVARIRVVARPWAHVMIDGKFHDTTPFATPIPVEPGTHTVRLEHPEAAPEERTIQVGEGQTALVDVALKLTRPIVLDREVERPLETTP